jgi:hypothetical protein
MKAAEGLKYDPQVIRAAYVKCDQKFDRSQGKQSLNAGAENKKGRGETRGPETQM